MNQTPLKERARGRWRGILPSLGLDSRHLTGKHGECPLCREGRDRFRFDDKDGEGTWICSRCGAGDGIKLVMLANGWEFKEAAEQIEALIGTVQPDKPKPERSSASVNAAMNRLWRAAEPLSLDNAAGRYLYARTGLTCFPACLRAARSVKYTGEPESFWPAMVAMITGPNGKPASLHRTYLTPEGTKAPVPDPKRTMPCPIPKGSAIRLAELGPVLGIAEGIETALSASALHGIPCWAAINTSILAQWEPPDGVREVVVFGDPDANYAGHAAAYTLAHRIVRETRSVRVEFPPVSGKDWNDVLLERERVAA